MGCGCLSKQKEKQTRIIKKKEITE